MAMASVPPGRHLHVLCKGEENLKPAPGREGVWTSGVWYAPKGFELEHDWIWLHRSAKEPAFQGGRVLARRPSASEDLTGPAPLNMNQRWTFEFTTAATAAPGAIGWNGATKYSAWAEWEHGAPAKLAAAPEPVLADPQAPIPAPSASAAPPPEPVRPSAPAPMPVMTSPPVSAALPPMAVAERPPPPVAPPPPPPMPVAAPPPMPVAAPPPMPVAAPPPMPVAAPPPMPVSAPPPMPVSAPPPMPTAVRPPAPATAPPPMPVAPPAPPRAAPRPMPEPVAPPPPPPLRATPMPPPVPAPARAGGAGRLVAILVVAALLFAGLVFVLRGQP